MPADTSPQPADKPLIFISYARVDGLDAARHLDTTLPGYGFRTWRDERGIDPAKDFTVEIEKAIRAADVVVACITADTAAREDSFVRREVSYAQVVNKPVIVARFADVPPPIQVINNTWVDYVGRDWPAADSDLRRLLGLPPEQLKRTTPPHDPFRTYTEWLYERMVRFLDQAVIRLIDLDVEADPDKVAPPPRRTEVHDIFDRLYLPHTLSADLTQNSDTQEGASPHGVPPRFDSFTAAYEHYEGRLLLLGDPGAGKSVTLMAFARDAAAQRLQDPGAPLPVFGVIATWDAENETPLADWLAGSHGDLSAQGITRLIDAGATLLLLDGLDELGNLRQSQEDSTPYDPRQRFLKQLPVKGHAVLSCRTEDYAEIVDRAPLQGAITLQPLSDEQIHAYLASDPDLLAAVEADTELRAMVRTPLIMSLFAFAYRDQSDTSDLRDLHRSPRLLRKAIFERYVKQRYHWDYRKHSPLPFTLEEIYTKLGHVAAENMLERKRGRENVLPFCDFEAALDGNPIRAVTFVAFLERLHFLRADGKDTFRFTHLVLRIHFASIPHLCAALNDPNRNIRRRAAEAMAQIGDREAIPALINALGDTDEGVRYSVAAALAEMSDTRAVPALLASLSDPFADIRLRAAEALGRIGDTTAVPELITTLGDTEKEGRESIALALGEIGDARAVPALITVLGGVEKNVRRWSAYALGKIGNVRAAPALIAVLSDDDRQVRESAANALCQIGTPAVPALITALGGLDQDARRAAVGVLLKIGASAVPALITTLNDEDDWVRESAADVLGQMGDTRAVPALITSLNDTAWPVSCAAADALGQMGDKQAVPALITALGDENEGLRSSAAEALGRIGDPQAVSALITILKDANENVRFDAADALRRIGDPRAVPALIATLSDTDYDVRSIAAEALGQIGDTRAVPALIAALDDSDYSVRRYAVRALGQIGDLETVPALVTALSDENEWVCRRAAEALEKIGTPEAHEAVRAWRESAS